MSVQLMYALCFFHSLLIYPACLAEAGPVFTGWRRRMLAENPACPPKLARRRRACEGGSKVEGPLTLSPCATCPEPAESPEQRRRVENPEFIEVAERLHPLARRLVSPKF